MKNIAISAHGFIEWNGGIDFLKNIIQGLIANEGYQCFLFIPQKELPRKNIFFMVMRFLARNTPFLFIKDRAAEKHFFEFKNHVTIVHYRRNSIRKVMDMYAIDITLPCATPLKVTKKHKWIGYLPDCQHRYLPHLFSQKEIRQRDKDYQTMIDTQKTILVNSVDTKNDLVKFYGAQHKQIHNLPFCPTLNLTWLESNENVLNAFSLPKHYFMIANQFWKHKDHATAFKALSLLQNQEIHIVCSGKMDDYRDSSYVENLISKVKELGVKEQVHFLGFIPKVDQIEILKKSLAIIQPTLFEGGPGGGCVYDAMALGVPCILSDIKINKEVKGLNTFYFKAEQAGDLAMVIEHFLTLDIIKPDTTKLRQMHKKNLSLRADSLNQLISKVLK